MGFKDFKNKFFRMPEVQKSRNEIEKLAEDFTTYISVVEGYKDSSIEITVKAEKTPNFPIFLEKEFYGKESNKDRILNSLRRMLSVDENLSLELNNIPEDFNKEGMRKIFRNIVQKLLDEKYQEKTKEDIAKQDKNTSSALEKAIVRGE